MIVLEAVQISKSYGEGALREDVLHDVSFTASAGETCLLMGPSGSGKTTMLSILGCLLTPTRGQVNILGTPVTAKSTSGLSAIRSRQIGFVFQHAHLLPFLTVEENLWSVGRNAGMSRASLLSRLRALAERLEIAPILHKYSYQISGGQQQRVAVARALLHRPPLILADEPTAALDWAHAQAVVRLLIQEAKTQGATLVAVTHDHRLLPLFDRALRLEEGRLMTGPP